MNVIDLVTLRTSIPHYFTMTDTEGTVCVEEGPLTYTAVWKIRGDSLVVHFRGKEEAAFLGSFGTEPETLARMLLKQLIDKYRGTPGFPLR
jgi:hypothetical protein